MCPGIQPDQVYALLRRRVNSFKRDELLSLFAKVDQDRVERVTAKLASYIAVNLPKAINNKKTLPDYRINPYVIMTTARSMGLDDVSSFAQFLVHSKLYTGLETSFGKSIESAYFPHYPVVPTEHPWTDPIEKLAEQAGLKGLGREDKARRRTQSVWREIDKSCVVDGRRYLVSVKSGPNTINDTQVDAMTSAIGRLHPIWLEQSMATYPEISGIGVVIGLTYGTDRTTNNKENQILIKLLEHGFVEEDRVNLPGVFVDEATGRVRVYRCIGKSFWGFVGNPAKPADAEYVFLEILLALAKALAQVAEESQVKDSLQAKLLQLTDAIGKIALSITRESLPEWIRSDFTDYDLIWIASAMSAFYDEGI